MATQRFELKVGFFVAFCLVVLAVLVLSISKGFSLMKTSYDIKLRTTDVGGIKQRASVNMSGVAIGNVKDIHLVDNGKAAVLTLSIKSQYNVYRDAQFMIEQAGLLGDQYVAVVPGANSGAALKQGDLVETAPATDFKQMLRSAEGLVERLDETVATLQVAVRRVDHLLLNETNLGSISRSLANAEQMTVRANSAMDRLDALVSRNAPVVDNAVTNVEAFTRQLKQLGAELNSVVVDNQPAVARVLKNVEAASADAQLLVADLKAGKGVVGGLLRDEALRQQVAGAISDLGAVSANLSLFSSNLNRYGIFYKPKTPRTNLLTVPYTGRNPFQ